MSPPPPLVVVTGCDRGVGLWVARAALDWGYKVVAGCMDPECPGGRYLEGCGAKLVKLDVTRPADIEDLGRTVNALQQEGEGRLEALVNNAGVLSLAPLEWHRPQHVAHQLRVNLEGLVLTTLALLPHLRRNKGRVINVSSPQGLVATPQLSVYCASKWGVEGFSGALRREGAQWGVRVVVVRPCNLPHKTGILSGNSSLLREMRDGLSPITREDFGPDVDAAVAQSKTAYERSEPRGFDPQPGDSHLLECFRLAITSSNPSNHYTAAPWVVRTYLCLLQMLPTPAVDWLLASKIHNTVLNWAKP